MNFYTIQEYVDAGCPEVGDATGIAIYHLTGGKICDTGCNRFQGGRCGAYNRLVSRSQVATLNHRKEEQTETVREEAARRGLSIKQVRRERREKANQ